MIRGLHRRRLLFADGYYLGARSTLGGKTVSVSLATKRNLCNLLNLWIEPVFVCVNLRASAAGLFVRVHSRPFAVGF